MVLDFNFISSFDQILKYDGNPSYACSIGAFFALQQLKLPRSHQLFTDRGYDDFELDAHEYLQLDHSLLSINLVVGKVSSCCCHVMIYNLIESILFYPSVRKPGVVGSIPR